MGAGLDMTNPDIVKQIKEKCGVLIKGVNDTTLNILKKTLSEGIGAKESIPTLSSRISKIYDEAKKIRVVEIAEDIIIKKVR